MIDIKLYHDGCNICQDISATMSVAFAADNHQFESINLSKHKARAVEAVAIGIKRLPSLVINGKIMRLEDHSPIEQYV